MSLVVERQLLVYPLPPVLVTSPYLEQLYRYMPAWVTPRRIRPVSRGLRELFWTNAPALLHLHFFDELCQRPGGAATLIRSLGFMAGLHALSLRGIPVVWTAHNSMPHETFHPRWAAHVYANVARQATAVIAHSYAAAQEIERRYVLSRPPFVIPHGNYVGFGGPIRDKEQARAALGLPGTGTVCLALGTLRPYKGLESLLDAFAGLPAGTARLLIVGGVKDAAYAQQLAHQVEACPGARLVAQHVPEKDLALYLGASDVVILPYRKMLTSGILLWALSYGRPVVAPAFGPIMELVREGQEGFLYTPGDAVALRAAIERALASPDLAAMGRAAIQRVLPFSWPRIAAQTALVYAEAARSSLA